MKTKLLILASAIASITGLNAGVIAATNINLAGPGDTIITLNGTNTPLATGFVSAGYFTAGFDVAANLTTSLASKDFTPFVNNWNSLITAPFYDENNVGANAFGYYSANVDYGNPGASAPLGSILYTFIGNQATLALSANVLMGGQLALLQSPETINGDTPTPDSNTLSPETSTLRLGSNGGIINYDFTPAGGSPGMTPSIQLYGVPEPSAVLLSAIGALGLLRRRRN